MAKRIVAFLEAMYQGFHKRRQQVLASRVAALRTVGKIGWSHRRAVRLRAAHKHQIPQVERFLSDPQE